MKVRAIAVPVLMLIVVAAACAPAPDQTPAPSATPEQPAAQTTSTSAIPTPGRSEPAETARDALSERVGVPAADIEIIDTTQDMFPSDNLGCPGESEAVTQPGMVAGVEVTLRIGEDTYVYRVRGRQAVLCQGPESRDG